MHLCDELESDHYPKINVKFVTIVLQSNIVSRFMYMKCVQNFCPSKKGFYAGYNLASNKPTFWNFVVDLKVSKNYRSFIHTDTHMI